MTAEVTEARVSSPDDDPHYWLGFRFPEDIDPDRSVWPAEVDRATYDAALEAREIEVRVLPDNPAAYEVEGEVSSWLGLITTLHRRRHLADSPAAPVARRPADAPGAATGGRDR